MLNKDHKDLIALLPAQAIEKYEASLLSLVAKKLMETNLDPNSIAFANTDLRRETRKLSTNVADNVVQAASQGISDGFMVNAITEVM